MQIVTLKLSELKPYSKNAKKHPKEQVEQIKNSINQFGMNDPIGIWGKENLIVEGHGRFEALKQLGYKDIDCIRLDHLTDEERKAYTLAHNKLTMNTDFDIDILNDELENIIDIDMSDFGFDFNFEDDEETIEVKEDDFNEDSVAQTEPKAKLGDIYQLGNHRLMCGDSTNIDDIEKLMNGNIADITFTSPPYNAGLTPTEAKMNNDSKYMNDSDNKNIDEYTDFLVAFTENALLNSQFVFVNIQSIANNKLSIIDYMYKLKDYFADTIIWDKMLSQPAMAENVLNSEFEYVHIFSKKANRSIGTIKFRGTLSNIVHIKKQTKNEFSGIHNATFSIDFATHFIKNFAKNSVLEPFGGTGTTMIVCEQLNRNCYMMEYEPHYVDVIIARWEKLTGKKAVLINE